MSSPQLILDILSDGRFHSGTQLGAKVGCSRAAIWKIIQSLQKSGVDIYSVRGKGYRLEHAIELLSSPNIFAAMQPELRSSIARLEVHYALDSTNSYLLDLSRQIIATGIACFAESQSAGRGRRGRRWISPVGGNIYGSLLWRFPLGAMQLGGLSLAVAVAVVRALSDIGVTDIGVKWPNDIISSGRKLAGILLEVTGEASGPCQVVIGVGINLRMPARAGQEIDQAWTDLETLMGKSIGRNQLAGRLLSHLVMVIRQFESRGLEPFLDEWRHLDCFAGREVCLILSDGVVQGIAQGVDASGALLLDVNGALRRYHSGEVSLRPAPVS